MATCTNPPWMVWFTSIPGCRWVVMQSSTTTISLPPAMEPSTSFGERSALPPTSYPSKAAGHFGERRPPEVPVARDGFGDPNAFILASHGLFSALARCHHCWHYERMAIQINIRDVPERVRDELAARAALQGKSMQEFLRAELERLAARPSVDAWLQQVRKRKRATQTRVSSKQILEHRNADRR